MSTFHNILVGIDLADSAGPDPSSLGPVADRAVRRGVWLARAARARLTFFSALNETRADHVRSSAEQAFRDRLLDLVRQAREQGVEAEEVVAPGKGWWEIIRQVLRGGHDLVVVSSRGQGGLRRTLFGGTASKLLHQCPCPVWVTRSVPGNDLNNILIASDLDGVSDHAVRLGLEVARLAGARTHLLTAVDYPLEHHWSTGQRDPWTEAYHQKVRADVEQKLRTQLERCAPAGGPGDVTLHLKDDPGIPDEAILQFIGDHAIDLLVLGTAAHAGLARLLVGNTAERLLPEVPCALLVVKPPDFQTSVRLD
jgi:nucleotide-binding universal stress UspA family protein